MLQRRRSVAVATVVGFGLVLAIRELMGDGAWFGLATFPGMAMLIAAARRLERQFGLPPLGLRSSPNRWSGAAGALLGGIGGWVGTWLANNVAPSKVPAMLLSYLVYAMLIVVLLYGSVLQDVADGRITVDQTD